MTIRGAAMTWRYPRCGQQTVAGRSAASTPKAPSKTLSASARPAPPGSEPRDTFRCRARLGSDDVVSTESRAVQARRQALSPGSKSKASIRVRYASIWACAVRPCSQACFATAFTGADIDGRERTVPGADHSSRCVALDRDHPSDQPFCAGYPVTERHGDSRL